MKNFHFLTLTALLFSGLSVAADNPTSVTAQIINQNPVSYKGKQVMLTGQIDRSLGNGAYVICDRNTAKSEDDSHHILVFTSGVSAKNADSKQQAGMAALKQGDLVQLTGKVEQFNVSNEVDTFSPKSDRETIDESSTNFPVIVARTGNLKIQR